MKLSKKKLKKYRITKEDFIKAVKKADREIEMRDNPGFKSTTRVHKSDKIYNRKKYKNEDID